MDTPRADQKTDQMADQKPATAARIYDYYIGGSHNFPADRAAAEAAIAQVPQIRAAARANRAFLGRAVRHVAQAGIRQFLDIGSGIPTRGNVHEIAQAVDPSARVVYVDMDAVAVSEGLQILAENRYATSVSGNLLDSDAILAHPDVRELIDFSEPVAVILCAVLHFVPDDEAARTTLDHLRSVSIPGSYLIMSHGTTPDDVASAAQRAEFAAGDEVVKRVYRQSTATPVRMRARAEVAGFFSGYDLIEPGLTWVTQWRPDANAPDDFAGDPSAVAILGGVGRRV